MIRSPHYEMADKRLLKFIYSKKATNFCEISTVDLSYVVTVKFTVEIFEKNCGLLRIHELYLKNLVEKNIGFKKGKKKYPNLIV